MISVILFDTLQEMVGVSTVFDIFDILLLNVLYLEILALRKGYLSALADKQVFFLLSLNENNLKIN
nr:hypothetical protein [uncultured Desulfobacter sp.]